MRMERMERNEKLQIWPFHAHTTHLVKPQHSSTSYNVDILRYIRVILWTQSAEKLRNIKDIPGSWSILA